MTLDGGSIKEANGRSWWFIALSSVASGLKKSTARSMQILKWNIRCLYMMHYNNLHFK